MPERFYDATTGTVKYADWSKEHNELAAWKAAEDSRKQRLPAADAYKAENSKEFKAPAGQSMNWNPDDTGLKMAREFAHRNGFSQDQFSEMLDLYAGQQIAREQAFKANFEAEKMKLGAAAQSRMDAVTNFINSTASPDNAKALLGGLWSAAQVQAIENIMDKFRTQGAGSYSTIGSQSPPPNGQIQGYEKMSFVQRRAAQDALKNPASGGR